MPQETKKQYLSTSEVSKKLHLSERSVRLMAQHGRLEGATKVKGHRNWLIPEESIPTVEQAATTEAPGGGSPAEVLTATTEAPRDGPPAAVVADAYKAHHEDIRSDLLRPLEVGVMGEVTGGAWAAWPRWLALRGDPVMRPFNDIMPQHLKGHRITPQFKDAVFDSHLSALSNLYAQWENARCEGNEAAAARDQLAYDRSHDELTDIIKQIVSELSSLSHVKLFPGSCRFCPAI